MLRNVYDKLGDDRRQRKAARLTDMLRMTIYRFVDTEDTLELIALLSKRERMLLSKSKIAKELKELNVIFSDDFWIRPKPIPAYILKVVQYVTFNIYIKGTVHNKKLKIAEKFASLI